MSRHEQAAFRQETDEGIAQRFTQQTIAVGVSFSHVVSRHLLTIDLGTSGPKAAVVSEDGVVVGSARASVRTEFSSGGGAEQDAEAVWRAVVDAMVGALTDAAVPASSFLAVVASSQYSSIVPVAADGTPVANMVLWMDQRGSPKRLRRLDGYPRLANLPHHLVHSYRTHGLPPSFAGMSISHMRRIRFARPDVYERTAAFVEPVDYVSGRLTGRPTANQCSSFMMLATDNTTVPCSEWDATLVARSLIDPDRFPEFVPVGSEVGTILPEVATELGLPATVPVLSGINDTQAGAVAAGSFRGSHAGLSLGTTSVITSHVPEKKTDPVHSLWSMPSPLGGTHLLSAENGVAGVAVDYFLDSIVYADDHFVTPATIDDRYRAFNEAAAAGGPGAGGVMFLPWLRGSIAPKADGRARGGFLNVGLDSTREHLARAVFEGVALNLRWMQKPVAKFVGRDPSHYVFYGGGAASDVWAQVMADVLQVPIHQMAQPGFANSLGTAMFALERLGMIDVDEIASRVTIQRVYEPDETLADRYAELADVFTDTFAKTRGLFKGLRHR